MKITRQDIFVAIITGAVLLGIPTTQADQVLPPLSDYGNFEDPEEIDLYDKMLRETDPAKQRSLIRDLEKYVLDTETHAIFLLWYYRMVPHRSYVKGWKISPSHYLNQDLATIWLDK